MTRVAEGRSSPTRKLACILVGDEDARAELLKGWAKLLGSPDRMGSVTMTGATIAPRPNKLCGREPHAPIEVAAGVWVPPDRGGLIRAASASRLTGLELAVVAFLATRTL